MLGLALIAADEFNGNAEKMARQALEWNPEAAGSPGTAGADRTRRQQQREGHPGSKEGARNRSQFAGSEGDSGGHRFSGRQDRKPPGIRTMRAATRPSAISSS
jgi:hypothetical protein